MVCYKGVNGWSEARWAWPSRELSFKERFNFLFNILALLVIILLVGELSRLYFVGLNPVV